MRSTLAATEQSPSHLSCGAAFLQPQAALDDGHHAEGCSLWRARWRGSRCRWGHGGGFPPGWCIRDDKARPDKFEAKARYRDLDGRTRRVAAWGKTATEAENNLRTVLKTRARLSGSAELKPERRVSVAAELFLAEVKALGEQDVLAPGTYQTYRYQYDKNLVPRIAEIRLVELTTPRVDGVIQAIRNEVGVASAKTCKSILSGTFSLAVRHGALAANPVREIKIRGKARRRPPRALEEDERQAWFELLRQDERAVRADLVDLCKFMLATGQRIGETFAVTWKEINRETGEVDCSHQIQRLRPGAGAPAGEVGCRRADSHVATLGSRDADRPLDTRHVARCPHLPGLEGRIPGPTQRSARAAERPAPCRWSEASGIGRTLSGHRRRAGLTQAQIVAKLGWRKTRISLIETGRVRLER